MNTPNLHMVIAIDLILGCDDETLTQSFSCDGKPMPAAEIRAELKRWKDNGYTYFPSCDNYDETGACKGHE